MRSSSEGEAQVTHPERRRYLIHNERGERVMSQTWELRNGQVVGEDASTASLVVVAKDLKDRNGKIAVLEEIIRKLRT
jgi:hypothetical protein